MEKSARTASTLADEQEKTGIHMYSLPIGDCINLYGFYFAWIISRSDPYQEEN